MGTSPWLGRLRSCARYAGSLHAANSCNDPAITDANKGIKLPADEIVVVHRAESSGTTYVWTDYLSKVSDEWKTKVGKGAAVNWPAGLGAKGNEAVTGT